MTLPDGVDSGTVTLTVTGRPDRHRGPGRHRGGQLGRRRSRCSRPTTSTVACRTTPPTPRPVPRCSAVRSSSCAQENPDTVFAAAGDLIGASTFESFIQNDKPTIDALNEAGLDVSAVGNHEFDQGYDDLVNRVMATYDSSTNPEGGAEWQYIGANVRLRSTGDPAVPASWIKDFDGRRGRLRRCGDRGPPVPGLARRHRRHRGHRHRRLGQRRGGRPRGRGRRRRSSCSSTRVRVDHARRRPPTTRTSARSSTESTRTSTRSSLVTPTSRTTTRSRSPSG